MMSFGQPKHKSTCQAPFGGECTCYDLDKPSIMENKMIAIKYEDFSKALDRPSLRDQFAMAALTGFLASGEVGLDYPIATKAAYKYADAMLKAREQEGE